MSIFIQVALAFTALGLTSRISKYVKSFFPPFYIIMGLLLGPLVLGWTVNEDVFQLLGNIGLVFLMFYLGYEFSLKHLSTHKREFFKTGLIDFLINFSLGIMVGLILDLSFFYVIVVAGIIYMSSSSIITKSLVQLGALKEKEGQLVMGIMVFEDLVMIIFIVLVGAFSTQGATESVLDIISDIGFPILFAIVLIYFAKKYPKIIDWIIGHKSHEVSHLGFMALILGVVSIGLLLNVKIALSAFLVGLMVSQAESKEDIEPVVIKFRDIFGGIFFFYFGMTFTFSAIPYPVWILILISFIAVAGKIISGVVLRYHEGCTFQDALFVGIITVPRGEFSLIIAGLVATTMPELRDIAVVVVLFTSIMTTIIFWVINLTCHTLDICVMSNKFINEQSEH